MQIRQTYTAIFLTSVLAGCASNGKDEILPQDGPTMKQVYDHHFTGQPLPDNSDQDEKDNENEKDEAQITAKETELRIKRRPAPPDYDLVGYTRDVANEINQVFPSLRNPMLVIYIYPHLSGSERHPVPGYSSSFTLYEKTEYALPGELEERY